MCSGRFNVIKSALIDYENLMDICYGCGSKITNLKAVLYTFKNFSIRIEKRPEFSSIPKESVLANYLVDNDVHGSWVEIKPKRRQGPTSGKLFQGNNKDLVTGTLEKESKGMKQGNMKKGLMVKDSTDFDLAKAAKETKPLRWDKHPRPMLSSAFDEHLLMNRDPQLVKFHYQLDWAILCALMALLSVILSIMF